MILRLPGILNPSEVAAGAAGGEAAGATVAAALLRDPLFNAAALPLRLGPVQIETVEPGAPPVHRLEAGLARRPDAPPLRADLVAVAFLSSPEDYDGGGLVVNATTAPHVVKLAAGDAVVFPATDADGNRPVTRGALRYARVAVESAVRGTVEREILAELWQALKDLEALPAPVGAAAHPARQTLEKARQNLIRMWAGQ